jgi:Zn-finger nucleic acid-binding protein
MMCLVCKKCLAIIDADPEDLSLKECPFCGNEIFMDESDLEKEIKYFGILLERVKEINNTKETKE